MNRNVSICYHCLNPFPNPQRSTWCPQCLNNLDSLNKLKRAVKSKGKKKKSNE